MTRIPSSPGTRVWRRRGRIVKQHVGPDADSRFARELTGLRLAAAVEPALVPRVLAIDPEHCRLDLERLDAAPGMPDWNAYVVGLAGLHSVDPQRIMPPARTAGTADVEALLRLCHALDVDVTADAEEELHALLERLRARPTSSLVHGDPCLGNVLAVGGRAYFVDFEQAASGDGLAELAFLRAGFPTCGWVDVVDRGRIAEAEATYFALRGGSVDVLDDHCAGWAVRGDMLVQRIQRGQRDQFERLLTQDWTWGPPTARWRLAHRLGVVAGTSSAALAATARLAGALRGRMIDRWPTCAG